ncbi:MAG TPA: CAP domain-containing protein [Pyrinomonadaceae bacterium]|nr:CAP domain-containing protein [Pyrinomonadaceae bacterium]
MSKIKFPRTIVLCTAQSALLLCTLSFAFIVLTAATASAQSGSNRPVARLITASGPALGRVPTRPRIVAPVSTSGPVRGAAMSSSANLSVSSLERRAFDLINTQRVANGEEPLVWDQELCRMARQHSESMARQDFFDHTGPDGSDMRSRAHSSNIRGWKALAENIAYNQGFDDPAGFAVQRWMRSSKHRDNILNSSFTRSAIGIARAADGRVFLTQVFIAR